MTTRAGPRVVTPGVFAASATPTVSFPALGGFPLQTPLGVFGLFRERGVWRGFLGKHKSAGEKADPLGATLAKPRCVLRCLQRRRRGHVGNVTRRSLTFPSVRSSDALDLAHGVGHPSTSWPQV